MPKFFRVAREGRTVDGREITASQINEMAETYDPKIYGARIWLEHFRSIFPDGLFKALGDVTSLKAEDDETGKRVLLAEINPTADLVKMNQDRQKVFTSVEIKPNFSDSGKAYLTGLAVTDSPASTGTEMLNFAQQFSEQLPKGVEIDPDKVFSDKLETVLEFNDDNDETEENKTSFTDKVKAMFSKNNAIQGEQFTDIKNGVMELAQQVDNQITELSSEVNELKPTIEAFKKLQTDFNELKTQLENTPQNPNHSQRPTADGDQFYQPAAF